MNSIKHNFWIMVQCGVSSAAFIVQIHIIFMDQELIQYHHVHLVLVVVTLFTTDNVHVIITDYVIPTNN